jgi:2-iminobutanoate/2-iminopropanoate deaminase
MIKRLNPDLGYLEPAIFEAVGTSQLVIAGNMVHWSGIVAARSGPDGVEFPADDVAGQLAVILDTLDLSLTAAGTDRTRIVSMTIFTTAIDDLSMALARVYEPWIGVHRPAVTSIGVARLSLPQILLEIQGVALAGDQK